jgi:hypothetical protein
MPDQFLKDEVGPGGRPLVDLKSTVRILRDPERERYNRAGAGGGGVCTSDKRRGFTGKPPCRGRSSPKG